MSSLSVVEGPDKGRRFVLRQFPASLGRDLACTICLVDPTVSTTHARLEKRENKTWLVDSGSRNGIFLNGKKVEQAELEDGDLISLGSNNVRFHKDRTDGMVFEDTRKTARIYPQLQSLDFDSSKLPQIDPEQIDPEQIDPDKGGSDRRLAKAYKLLALLYKLDRALSAVRELEPLQQKGLELILRVIPAERGTIQLVDPQSGELAEPTVLCSDGLPAEVELNTVVLDAVLAQKETLLSGDVHSDPRFVRENLPEGLHSLMCVPLISLEQVHGMVQVEAQAVDKFQQGDRELLTTLSHKLATAIANVRHAEQLKTMFHRTVATLVTAIQAKDKYTRGHSERVRRYARALGEALELPPYEQECLEISAVLHDVGKIGMPDKILIHNDDPLTPEELETVKVHPLQGAKLLSKIPELEAVVPGVKWHHEDYGGGGYPDDMVGEDIPLQARIIAIADTYDAVTTDRPYQKGVSKLEGLEILKKLKGTRLDPALVDLFVDAMRARYLARRWSGAGDGTSMVR